MPDRAAPPPDAGPLLILAPTGRDAEGAAALLGRQGVACRAVPDLAALCAALDDGTGAVLAADEALAGPGLGGVARTLAAQPPWSDLPFVVLTRGGAAGRTAVAELRLPAVLGNPVFLERPLNALTLVGAVRSALRARVRQRQLRAHLAEREAAAAAARASEAHWRGLFERMHEGFVLGEVVRHAAGRAVDYRYLELNAAFERLTGVARERALGRTVREVFPGVEPAWIEVCARVVETGEPARHLDHAGPLGRWFELHVYRPEPGRFAALFLDVTERRRAEERQTLLAREVDHRAKNALAVVQAALRLTRAADVPDYVRSVEGRVAALARAHTLLAADSWSGADLRTLLQGELAPFLGGGGPGQGPAGEGPHVELDGPGFALPPGAAQPLAMAAHELATNAVKHGALSVPRGRVSVSWRTEAGPGGIAPLLRLRWAETGGPPVAGPPGRRGFGSRVLDATVRGQLGGRVSLAWAPTGLVCEMDVPLGRSAPPGRDPVLAAAD
jgi:PAS domain S-box-containing protein